MITLNLGAQSGWATNAECRLALTDDQGSGLALNVELISPTRPPVRIQSSTDLVTWLDWQYPTGEVARLDLTVMDPATSPGAFFRNLPMQLDLTNWKLTLPVDTARQGSPDEVKQPELATFQDLDYFHTNAAGRGIVFRAPCGGVTTSNSVFPRSELLEMAGNSRASWSTTVGTHTLEVVEAITHLPDFKRDVAAGQIHDLKTGLIILKLQGQKLVLFENGVRGPLLTSDYNLGDPFSLKLIARNGTVETYFNGRYIWTSPLVATNCYFKAGCYTLSNTNLGDAPTAYGEVIIYGLSVRHDPAL